MDLTGIISISGKPGLYKVIAQGKNNIIVESLVDNKRIPAYASDRISALDDISIYTHDGDKPLKDVLEGIYAKENGKECLSHKEDISKLQNYLLEIIPDYDDERVYPSDVKKVFQWYNMLLKYGVLTPEAPKEEEKEKKETKKTEKSEVKKTAAKKPAGKKTTNKQSAAKSKTSSAKSTVKPRAVKKGS